MGSDVDITYGENYTVTYLSILRPYTSNCVLLVYWVRNGHISTTLCGLAMLNCYASV